MAKHSKRSILLIVLTLCAALCFGLLAACKDPKPTDTSVAYTVTVMKNADEAATGVKVTVKKGGATYGESKTTDSLGKVEFSLPSDSYTVALSDLPEHYEVPASANLTMTADDPDLTVTLAKKFAYEVNLVNPDGTPYTGNVSVIACTLTDNCLDPVAPVNGTAYLEIVKGNYHVKVDGLPAGYTYEQDADGYYIGEGKNFTETETTMTIKICPVTTVDLSATPMTEEEINAFATAANVYGLTTELDAYKFTKSVTGGNTAYYAITPAISGKYNIYRDDPLIYYFDGTSFSAEAISSHTMPQYMTLAAGNTYYFKVVNGSTETMNAQFVLTVPASTYLEYDGVNADNLELSVGKANAVATIAFKPTTAGTYTVTVQGDTSTILDYSTITPSIFLPSTPDPDAYVTGASLTIDHTPKAHKYNGVKYITVAVKADTYPADVAIKIVRTGNSPSTYTYADVESTLAKYADVTNGTELIGVPVDGTAELVYHEDTDTYTYNGKTVVVNITKPLDEDRFEQGFALAYMALNYQMDFPFTYEITKPQTEGNGEDVVNYTKFLRGFENYVQNGRAQEIPEELEEDNCYAAFVNSDGVYPLNKELKDFLEDFYIANESTFYFSIAPDSAFGCEWMFPLYYYGYGIVGEYVGTYDGTDYVLTVSDNGELSFSLDAVDGEDPYDFGTWSKGDDGYTFTATYGTLTYNDSNGTFTYSVDGTEDEEGIEELTLTAALSDPIVGKYTCMVDDELRTLTVKNNGTFVISDQDGTVESGTWEANDGTYIFKGTAWDNAKHTYTVYVNEGTLEFFDDPDAFEPVYTFEVASDREVMFVIESIEQKPGYVTGPAAIITVYEDLSFEISLRNFVGQYDIIADGTVTDIEEIAIGVANTYEGVADITVEQDDDEADKIKVTVCYDDEEIQDPVYTFYMPDNGGEEEVPPTVED